MIKAQALEVLPPVLIGGAIWQPCDIQRRFRTRHGEGDDARLFDPRAENKRPVALQDIAREPPKNAVLLHLFDGNDSPRRAVGLAHFRV